MVTSVHWSRITQSKVHGEEEEEEEQQQQQQQEEEEEEEEEEESPSPRGKNQARTLGANRPMNQTRRNLEIL